VSVNVDEPFAQGRDKAKAFFDAHPGALQVTIDAIRRSLKDSAAAAAAGPAAAAAAGRAAAAAAAGVAAGEGADVPADDNALEAEDYVTG
jgi:hypothetical protein